MDPHLHIYVSVLVVGWRAEILADPLHGSTWIHTCIPFMDPHGSTPASPSWIHMDPHLHRGSTPTLGFLVVGHGTESLVHEAVSHGMRNHWKERCSFPMHAYAG